MSFTVYKAGIRDEKWVCVFNSWHSESTTLVFWRLRNSSTVNWSTNGKQSCKWKHPIVIQGLKLLPGLSSHLLICLGWLSGQERNSMTLRVPPRCIATILLQRKPPQDSHKLANIAPPRSESGPFWFFIWDGGANLPSPAYNIRYTNAQIRISDSHSKISSKWFPLVQDNIMMALC